MADFALDTIASILRALGEYAVVEEPDPAQGFRRTCEQWAQHVLLAAPPPGSDRAPLESARRDWAAVRQFVVDHCRTESQYVNTLTTDLRQVVWSFVQSLHQTLGGDAETDRQMHHQLLKLETLAAGSSTEELRREVKSAVAALTQLAQERRARHHQQIAHLGDQVRTLGHALEEVRQESAQDPLTRLFNRRALDEQLSRAIVLHQLLGESTCLVLVDVDHFKMVNDTFGHLTGDAVLRELANCMARIFMRKSDFVARYGGEEFAIVLRDTTLDQASALCERLLQAVRGLEVVFADTRVSLTVSMGLSRLEALETAAEWVARADRSLYQAKAAGRDRLIVAASPGTVAPAV